MKNIMALADHLAGYHGIAPSGSLADLQSLHKQEHATRPVPEGTTLHDHAGVKHG